MIQFLHSGLRGAPGNTANAGSVTALLDDCLVNGFNVLAPATVTVSAGVATLSYAASHGYTADQYLRVSGAAAAQVNGDKLPTILNAQTLTVPAPGAPDGPAGGSVQTRFAPLGWAIEFSDTNVRVFRSPNPQSTRMFFRLQDTGVTSYNVNTYLRGYEAMGDVNTGTGPFPTDGQTGGGAAGKVLFSKGNNAAFSKWLVVGDDRTVYMLLNPGSTNTGYYGTSFGDFASYKDGDQYNALIQWQGGGDGLAQSWIAAIGFCPRSVTQLGAGITLDHDGPLINGSGSEVYPSPVVDGFTLLPTVLVRESTLAAYRGQHRGLMHVAEKVTYPSAEQFGVFSSLVGITGRVLMCTLSNSTGRRIAFALDQPW